MHINHTWGIILLDLITRQMFSSELFKVLVLTIAKLQEELIFIVYNLTTMYTIQYIQHEISLPHM